MKTGGVDALRSYKCSGKQFAGLMLWFLVAGMAMLFGNSYRSSFLLGAGMMVMGCFCALATWVTLKTGEARTNWGTFRRDHAPIGFWFHVVLEIVGFLCVTGFSIAIIARITKPGGW